LTTGCNILTRWWGHSYTGYTRAKVSWKKYIY